jgi:hypothetical protein
MQSLEIQDRVKDGRQIPKYLYFKSNFARKMSFKAFYTINMQNNAKRIGSCFTTLAYA